MTATGWTLALITIALAVGIGLLGLLPRRAPVLVVSSVVGAVVGVLMLWTHTEFRMCDFLRPGTADRCTGTYVAIFGEHRLPQFMQTPKVDAWLVATGVSLGIVLADLFALGAMWLSSRLGRNR